MCTDTVTQPHEIQIHMAQCKDGKCRNLQLAENLSGEKVEKQAQIDSSGICTIYIYVCTDAVTQLQQIQIH